MQELTYLYTDLLPLTIAILHLQKQKQLQQHAPLARGIIIMTVEWILESRAIMSGRLSHAVAASCYYGSAFHL